MYILQFDYAVCSTQCSVQYWSLPGEAGYKTRGLKTADCTGREYGAYRIQVQYTVCEQYGEYRCSIQYVCSMENKVQYTLYSLYAVLRIQLQLRVLIIQVQYTVCSIGNTSAAKVM